MLKTLTTAAGLVVLVSSFAFAGQAPAKPTGPPTVTAQQQTQANAATKKHHKHHKHHKKQAAGATKPHDAVK